MAKKQHPTKTMNISSDEFRKAGYALVDQLADLLDDLPSKSVTTISNPSQSKELLAHIKLLPEGEDLHELLRQSSKLLIDNSLFNGHPRFWGYITSSAAPVGALGDLLASSINSNVGAFALSPMATEIEKQTIGWLSTFIGYDPTAEGVFVSGGNMANFLGFLTARNAKTKGLRENGLAANNKKLLVYCAQGTHTWIQKAADLFGHGTNCIRWIDTNEAQQLDTDLLEKQIQEDLDLGHHPFLVIGNAGSVSTGTVDDLQQLATIAQKFQLWFHVDGAYGAPAAGLAELSTLFQGIQQADSIAMDPHKWLYSPLEAGCILVRHPGQLQKTFGFSPDYYNFGGDDDPTNFHEFGLQNSRGFRALKVWLSLRHVGKIGLEGMIRKDIDLSKALYELVKQTPQLEALTCELSITTFRYVPEGFESKPEYLNELNEKLLDHLQKSGEVYPSNAVIDGKYAIRVCIVNFRTELEDLVALVDIVIREGKQMHDHLKVSLLI